MGNGYNHDHHQDLHQRSNFLPMLCSRPSNIKDVHLPRFHHHQSSSSSSSSSAAASDIPSSPKVSCMGQVKIRNNRVTGFPTIKNTTLTPTTTIKHHRLKRFFSGKNLTPTTTTTTRREMICIGSSGAKLSYANKKYAQFNTQLSYHNNDCNFVVPPAVNVAELDPPLPVVKRAGDGGRDEASLWKRRSGGAALKSLQLQQIQMPNKYHCGQPISTV